MCIENLMKLSELGIKGHTKQTIFSYRGFVKYTGGGDILILCINQIFHLCRAKSTYLCHDPVPIVFS